jgi:glycosyltransferase involved in cell wall biosynthesis
VGGGEDLPELQQMAEELGVAERVRWVGRVPLDEVPGYYCLGEFSVAPMRDTVLARSSLSIKVAESLVAGVPCLVANIGDYKATVGAAGLAVAPGSVKALADGILTLLRNPETLAEMRAAARKMRDQYTWDRLAERFVQIYDAGQASR